MTLGPQFYPKAEGVEQSQNLSKDTPLYHGTGGGIEGDVIKPGERSLWGEGAYAVEGLGTAEAYARAAARDQGRLFGTVYQVTPVSDQAKHVGSQSGKAILLDPEGLKAERIVSFPEAIQSDQYTQAIRRAAESAALWSSTNESRTLDD